jgi:hypothetical protein
VRGNGTKLGEGSPKVRLSQDKMAIFSQIRDFYANPDSGILRSGLFHLGKVCGAVCVLCK